MTFKTIVIFVILFFVIRFLLRFLIPVIKVTRQAQKGIHDLKSQMEAMQQQQHNSATAYGANAKQNHSESPKIDGEYIDYEEVK